MIIRRAAMRSTAPALGVLASSIACATRSTRMAPHCAQVPSFRQVYLDDFASRGDLLDAALASSHIPFLLDWQPTARAAGKRFIGGHFRPLQSYAKSHYIRPVRLLASSEQLVRGVEGAVWRV